MCMLIEEMKRYLSGQGQPVSGIYDDCLGEILLDKLPTARTVVVKRDIIENEFRTFEMAVVAGEHDLVTECTENQCTFRIDFASIYWNPRLGSSSFQAFPPASSLEIISITTSNL